jgi:DNA-binding transcriptional LysR family regulator
MDWDNLKVRDLQRFVAVMESQSFTRAASSLDETPKQLSRRVAQMEERLGVRLFHRTTRSVSPTNEATLWYTGVRQVLDQLQEATHAIQPTSELTGRVRVQVPTLLIDTVLDWTGEQLERYPNLGIDLLVGDDANDLIGRGIDVCLTGVQPQGATLLVRRVTTVSPVLAAHRDYTTRAGCPLEPERLRDHRCLRFTGQSAWPLVHDDGRSRIAAVTGGLCCNDSRTLQRALLHGMGIGPLTSQLEQHPDLVVVCPGWRFETVSLYLVLAPSRRRLARVRHVADGLAALAKEFTHPSG